MATKTISVDEDAYNKLKKMKEEGESFSDVIKKMSNERSLLEIAGIWKDDELKNIVEENREKAEEELDEVAEEFE